MEIKPINNLVLAKLIGNTQGNDSVIALPDEGKLGRFIKLEVLDVGELVQIIKKGDKVIANNLFEVIDPRQKDVGFINSKDVLGVIKNG